MPLPNTPSPGGGNGVLDMLMSLQAPQPGGQPMAPPGGMGMGMEDPFEASDDEKTAVAYVMSAIEMLDFASQVYPPIMPVVERIKGNIQQEIGAYVGNVSGPPMTASPVGSMPPGQGLPTTEMPMSPMMGENEMF